MSSVYLNAFETGFQVRKEIGAWLSQHNETRSHSTFDGQTPDEVYYERGFSSSASGYARYPDGQI